MDSILANAERITRLEAEMKAMQSNCDDCRHQTLPSIFNRLRRVELQLAAGFGGLAALEIVLRVFVK